MSKGLLDFDFEKDCEEGFKLGIKSFEELHEGDLLLSKEKLIKKIKMKCDFLLSSFYFACIISAESKYQQSKKDDQAKFDFGFAYANVIMAIQSITTFQEQNDMKEERLIKEIDKIISLTEKQQQENYVAVEELEQALFNDNDKGRVELLFNKSKQYGRYEELSRALRAFKKFLVKNKLVSSN